MADDETTSANATPATTSDAVTVRKPAKRSGGRQSKAAAEKTGGPSTTKSPRAARKVVDNTSAKSTAGASKPTELQGRKSRSKQVERPPAAPAGAIEEMADLVQLEEENQRLRKALSEKLRAENAALRGRLGLD